MSRTVDLDEPARSTEQAATVLGLSPKTLRNMRSRGGGPAFCKLGGRVVYLPDDLRRWLADNRMNETIAPTVRHRKRSS